MCAHVQYEFRLKLIKSEFEVNALCPKQVLFKLRDLNGAQRTVHVRNINSAQRTVHAIYIRRLCRAIVIVHIRVFLSHCEPTQTSRAQSGSAIGVIHSEH